jgi:UDP-N-acetylglucosamine enolpyruvyl transferase
MTSPVSETAAPTVLEIHGGKLLAGATLVDGSKNAALPLLVATHLEDRHPVTL